MKDPADECPDACDRSAYRRIATAREMSRVGEALRERHRDAGAERGCESGDEGVVRLVRHDRDGEDRCERGERSVDQSDHRGLDALEKESVTVGHRLEYNNRVAKW